jgi:hypothetical protein
VYDIIHSPDLIEHLTSEKITPDACQRRHIRPNLPVPPSPFPPSLPCRPVSTNTPLPASTSSYTPAAAFRRRSRTFSSMNSRP